MDRQGIRGQEQFFEKTGASGLLSVENAGLIIFWRGIPFRGTIYSGEPDRVARVWVIELDENIVREIILRGEITSERIRIGEREFILPDFGVEGEDSIMVSSTLSPGSNLDQTVRKWLRDAFGEVSVINILHEKSRLIITTSQEVDRVISSNVDSPIIVLSETSIPLERENTFLMTKPFTKNQFLHLLRETGLLN